MIEPGSTLGRHRILERVGRGGMGVLYRAVDPTLDREVAIKVMSASFHGDDSEEDRARFFREARAAARLQHRNIVSVFELAEDEGVPYIVMEFLHGQTLAARMQAAPPLSLNESLDIVTELCGGLEFAHNHGVVHRDVKPANVWLMPNGSVKLLDFGIARLSGSTSKSQGGIRGSAPYLSPEQAAGKPVDGRSDLFSVCVVLYELVCGRKPFEGDTPTSTMMRILQDPPRPFEPRDPACPPALERLVMKGLDKDPAKRHHGAGELGTELKLLGMSLHGAADTVFLGAGALGTTLKAAAAAQATAMPVDELPLHDPKDLDRAPGPLVPAPARRRSSVAWIGMVAAVVVVGVVAWLGLGRGGDAAPAAAAVTVEPQAPAAVEPPPAPPVEPEPAPPVRQLHLTTDPDGARVEVDGKDSGLVTPATLAIQGEDPSRIRFVKSGFRPAEVSITSELLAAGAVTSRLEAIPAPRPVTVVARGNYPFDVVDGRRVLSGAATSHEVRVTGARVLRLQAPAFLLDYQVRVPANAASPFEIEVPDLGRISIRSTMETCRVTLGGKDVGFPPITEMRVAAGTYDVALDCPDGREVRGASVTIVGGQTLLAKIP